MCVTWIVLEAVLEGFYISGTKHVFITFLFYDQGTIKSIFIFISSRKNNTAATGFNLPSNLLLCCGDEASHPPEQDL
jgi:hypothetical protein